MNHDMKALVRGFVKWLIIVLLGLNAIIWASAIAHCQTVTKEPEHMTLHPDKEEWEDSIGFYAGAITSKDERLIYITRKIKMGLKLTSLGWDKNTRFDDPAAKPYKLQGECFAFIYCKKHLMAYVVQRIPCSDNINPMSP